MAHAMPLNPSRIQGFGSDGSKRKVYSCPAGHLLQSCRAVPGKCKGCKVRIPRGAWVMDCRQCRWFLCEACHPQEKEQQGWFWNSVTFLVDIGTQEMNDIGEDIKDLVGNFSLLGACISAQGCEDTKCKVSKQTDPTKAKLKSKKQPAMDEVDGPSLHLSHADANVGLTYSSLSGRMHLDVAEPRDAALNSAALVPFEAQQRKAPIEDPLDRGQSNLLYLDAEPAISTHTMAVGGKTPAVLLEGFALGGSALPKSSLPGQVASPRAASDLEEQDTFLMAGL